MRRETEKDHRFPEILDYQEDSEDKADQYDDNEIGLLDNIDKQENPLLEIQKNNIFSSIDEDLMENLNRSTAFFIGIWVKDDIIRNYNQ